MESENIRIPVINYNSFGDPIYSYRMLKREPRHNPEGTKRILVKIGEIDNLTVLSPILKSIANRNPESEIHLTTLEKNIALLKGIDFVKDIFPIGQSNGSGSFDKTIDLQYAKQASKGKPEMSNPIHLNRREGWKPEINYGPMGEPIISWRPIIENNPPIAPIAILKKLDPAKSHKTIGIIQPGSVTDIPLCLPIAKWYHDKGYQVFWPVESEFLPLFDHVAYVIPIDLGKDKWRYTAAIGALFKNGVKKIIDLDMGFSRDEEDLMNADIHPDERKYKDAGVPFERYKTKTNRVAPIRRRA